MCRQTNYAMMCRWYHTSCVFFNLKKQAANMNKLLNAKNRKQWYPNNTFNAQFLPSVKSLTKTQRVPGKQGIRRIAMLNKLFMKHITDLMSTGTVAMDIVGRGIEISKVTVTPDLQSVNVFWVCKGDGTDEETETILQKTGGALRHELSTLRVMGEVPYIVFVKDKQEARVVDLDRRLAIADYGEDYTQTELGQILKTEFTLNTKLSPEMKAKIKQLEDQIELIEDPIPEMTHTVFGLDHEKILKRLLAARKRSKDAWSSIQDESAVISYRARPATETRNLIINEDIGNQKQELADFLRKRQILQDKLRKQMLNSRPELELHEEQDDADDEPYYEDPYEETEEDDLEELYDNQNSPRIDEDTSRDKK